MKKNNKKNKTLKRMGTVALVSCLVLSGSAWLTSRQTAAGVNKIKTGETSIMFDQQLNKIEIKDNNAIPMTKDYAIANLTAYEFDIKNSGTIALDYKISVSAEGYANNFPADKINLIIAKVDKSATTEEKKTALAAASVQKVSAGKEIATFDNTEANASQTYNLIAYVDESTLVDEYTGNSASFKLEVNATQAGVSASDVATTNLLLPFFDSTSGENIKSNPYIKTVQFMYEDQSGTLDTSKYSVEGLPEGFTYEAGPYSLDIKYSTAMETTLTNIRILYDGAEIEIYDENGVLISQPLTIDIVKN